MMFRFRNVHCKTKTKLLICLSATIWLIQASLLLWFGFSTIKRQNPPPLYASLSESLIKKETLNASRGKLLKIRHTQETSGDITQLNLTLDIVDVSFPKVVNTKPHTSSYPNKTSGKYAFVMARYWEQLTQSMRAYLALVLQAASSGRSVVSPMVKNSRFQTNGFPISYYFDTKHIREILRSNDYPNIVDKEEFFRECSISDPHYTTVHFLYDQEKAATWTKNKFNLDEKTYSTVSKEARTKGWTQCSFIQKLTKQTPESKMFCVDTTVVTDWKILERDVIKSAKCLSIVLWRGIGDTFRARFKEKHLKLYSRDFFVALNPSPNVINIVQSFQKRFLGQKYIGVQIRGEHVAITHGLERLKQCISLLGDVLKLIKGVFDIEKVFIATDMSQFGSASWKDSVKGDVITDETLPELQNLVLSVTNGVTFDLTTENGKPLDRGLVALIDVTLVSQAQTLLTIGHSSFHEWTTLKFLDFHRNDSPVSWSLVKLCFKDS